MMDNPCVLGYPARMTASSATVDPLLLDDIPGMVVFAAVAERGSFTAAARALGLAKSVVSARVARLEGRLGVRLLYRSTRRVALTPEGTTLYPACARVARAAEDVRAQAGEAGELRGRLRVNAPVSFGHRWLAAPLGAFMARHPGVRVEVVLQDDRVDVVGGGWDAVIRFGVVTDPELVARRFVRAVGVVVAAPEYLSRRGTPATPLDLAGHACLRYGNVAQPAEWTFSTPDGPLSVPVDGPAIVSDGTLLMGLAEGGVGVGILPWHIVGESVRAGRLVRVLAAWPSLEILGQVVHAHGPHAPARLKVFVDHLVASFRVAPWGTPTVV